MTDPAAATEPEATPAPQAPVLTAEQIEDMISRKAQEISDRRIGGLQAMYDRKLKEIADENKRISRSLAGTEDDVRQSDLEAELKRQERENRYLRVALENPDLAPFIGRFDPDASPEDIATALKEYRQTFVQQPATQQTPTEPQGQPAPTPGVEPNNPRREATGWEPGVPLTGEAAERFFDDLPKGFKWPSY